MSPGEGVLPEKDAIQTALLCVIGVVMILREIRPFILQVRGKPAGSDGAIAERRAPHDPCDARRHDVTLTSIAECIETQTKILDKMSDRTFATGLKVDDLHAQARVRWGKSGGGGGE